MKQILFLFTVSLLGSLTSKAQSGANIYFELGGPGLASFNFDTRFAKKEDGLGGRIGIGGFSLRTTFNNGTGTSTERASVIFVPVGVNYLLGKDGKNYFELGAGVTPVFTSSKNDLGSDNFSSTFGNILFGYRMQPQNGGFTFRAFINPIFGSFGFVPYYGGVSFGYKFGGHK
ncbi:MAG: hypothetical protein HYR66_11100 [Sphingobacteriales bacterium]|nr:hypothetical protein [Sphingobacteriales bacterium]MBI3720814.1 hypothetical protein [Sphingobacteriales bacterium]